MRINVRFAEDDAFHLDAGSIQTQTENDYEKLKNRPSINSVLLEGALSAEDLGLGMLYYDTKENWDFRLETIAERGVVYVYSDYDYIEDEVGNKIAVAGIKIGDGTSYLIDMPFVTDATTAAIISHVTNSSIHVTAAEKEFWNNKVSAFMDHGDAENLIISKTQYEKDGTIITA